MEVTGAYREPGGAHRQFLRAFRSSVLNCEIDRKFPERRLAQRRADARSNGRDTRDPGDSFANLLEDSGYSGADFDGLVVSDDAGSFHELPGGQAHLERNNVLGITARGSVVKPEKCVQHQPSTD